MTTTTTGYRVLERTVTVHAALEEKHVEGLSHVLGRKLHCRPGTRDFVIDAENTDLDGLLHYLRARRMPHTVSEERRYDATTGATLGAWPADTADMEEAHAQGMHDDLPREGCPECNDKRNRR